jgi:hypothetical protein
MARKVEKPALQPDVRRAQLPRVSKRRLDKLVEEATVARLGGLTIKLSMIVIIQ